jgi:hypothetical protein
MACTDSTKAQTGAVRGDPDRVHRAELDEALVEIKRLAQKVAAAWTSPRSGVELVELQRR